MRIDVLSESDLDFITSDHESAASGGEDEDSERDDEETEAEGEELDLDLCDRSSDLDGDSISYDDLDQLELPDLSVATGKVWGPR